MMILLVKKKMGFIRVFTHRLNHTTKWGYRWQSKNTM